MAEPNFLFNPGFIVCTPAALRALTKANATAREFIERHLRGDYGEICAENRAQNEIAVANDGPGGRVMSSYRLATRATVWVITEADRSVTTLLLPEDY